VHRLLEDFDSIVHFDRPIGGETIGQALEGLLSRARNESGLVWGTSGIASNIATMQRECMHYFYRPHLHPGLDEKVQLVHKLQFHLLPVFCPTDAPVHLATVLESFSQLSGDLLGWRFLPDGSFLFWILDISGHGLKAGLLCAVLKSIIDRLEDVTTLEGFVRELNDRFMDALREPDELYYATGVFMRVPGNGTLEYISAAHPQVFLKQPDGRIDELASTAIPLGLYTGKEFECRRLPLEARSMLLLYTDGVTEAENPEGEQFGIGRVKKVLEVGYQYPEEVATALYKSLWRFQAIEHINDDVTFLTAKVK
jgi:sigma-B regulation protein RsbU (phosphoserine phosphatase)